MTARSIARNTRSGTLVGPGICRKWRPVCMVINALRTCISSVVQYSKVFARGAAKKGCRRKSSARLHGDKWDCHSERSEESACLRPQGKAGGLVDHGAQPPPAAFLNQKTQARAPALHSFRLCLFSFVSRKFACQTILWCGIFPCQWKA